MTNVAVKTDMPAPAAKPAASHNKPNKAATSTSGAKATSSVPARTAVVERTPAFPLTAAITVVATANPKRPGTKAAVKWEYYKGAKTVADVVENFKKANLPRRKAMSAIRWDSEHGHITVG